MILLIKACLVFVLIKVVVFTQPKLKPSQVVGGYLDLHINLLSFSVSGHNSSSGIFSWGLIILWTLPGVPAYPTLSTIHIPLILVWLERAKSLTSLMLRTSELSYRKSSTIFFIVCVVFGCAETSNLRPPGSTPSRRFPQGSMTQHMRYLQVWQLYHLELVSWIFNWVAPPAMSIPVTAELFCWYPSFTERRF